ncbi:MAG: ergothioneine biosynthesis protein EgtB [Polyangiaceae bacterium]|jgi:ergothioneine biosynthesis protein EgtB|nr:ergothioneine biosynthesis protein EgtB [Polyangiaceae bacterium]
MNDRAQGEGLLARYLAVRAATEGLAAPLSAEDQAVQSMPDCSPTKWHRAHTTWFFEEFVLVPRGVSPVDERYRYLFNSYYEAVGPRHARPERGLLTRPSTKEIGAYRRAVDEQMSALLLRAEGPELEALLPLIELGLAHEEQHQELLLTDILHAFSMNPLLPAYREGAASWPGGPASPVRFQEHAGGLVQIGATGAGFSFDNERPRHRVWVEPFALASRLITVGEVRAFLEAGGYRTPSLWLAAGMDFVRQHGLSAPLHARVEGGSYRVFTLDGLQEASDDEPASHLSYYEADAIARFLGGRLPTEVEWEIAASGVAEVGANFRETGALRPLPAAASPLPSQLFGDTWEWTSSAYAPYPGFSTAPGAVGEYNGKFMVNQLVLRGGSCFTPRGHARASYRNFWPASTRFQMTGARLARSL